MISINYQTFGTGNFKLRLRLYQDRDTKFLNKGYGFSGGFLE